MSIPIPDGDNVVIEEDKENSSKAMKARLKTKRGRTKRSRR
jgi:hypothetical protein